MRRHEETPEWKLIRKLIMQAEAWLKQGRLVKSSHVLHKAACLILAELKANPGNKTLLSLKNKLEICRNKITHAMIKKMSPY